MLLTCDAQLYLGIDDAKRKGFRYINQKFQLRLENNILFYNI